MGSLPDVGLSGLTGEAARLSAEEPRLEWSLAFGPDPVGGRAGPRSDDLMQLGADEVERDPVVRCEACRQTSSDELCVHTGRRRSSPS